MALWGVFETKELDAFATAVAADLARRVPPASPADVPPVPEAHVKTALEDLTALTAAFQAQHKLGYFKRVNLGSTLQQKLTQLGFSGPLIERATQALVAGLGAAPAAGAAVRSDVPSPLAAESTEATCPICAATAVLVDVVDFNKSCEEARGKFLPLAGTPIYYTLCDGCGFCFAPQLHRWPMEEFAARIYNHDYGEVDPDYLDVRPRANAKMLADMFARQFRSIRHLDYGGGNGLLSKQLATSGWDTASYDPFVDGPMRPGIGLYNLVTSFEVFEHVPDVNSLINTLASLVSREGMVLFSTLLSDGKLARNQRVQWWYASPRNGHISLFSHRSLALLGQKKGFELVSFSPNLHAFWRKVPAWTAGAFSPG